jgi:hypothetical protein
MIGGATSPGASRRPVWDRGGPSAPLGGGALDVAQGRVGDVDAEVAGLDRTATVDGGIMGAEGDREELSMPRSAKREGDDLDAIVVEHEVWDRHDPGDAPLDSEIDFDDEADEDQLPLDQVEAIELGVNLDDPEQLDDE